MFKSIIRILTFVTIVLSINIPTVANAANPVVFLNNQQIYFSDVQPTIIDGTTLIPVRGVFENMRCTVEWDGAKRCVRIQRNSLVIAVQIENKQMTVGIIQGNGKIDESWKELDVAPCIINGRTMIPLRAISQGLGAGVEWIPENYRINIYDESIMPGVIVETPINAQVPYINWNDRGVEQCVRDMLGLPIGNITFENCANIYELDLRGYNVTNIFDLIYFPNLKSLYIEDVRYIDLAPLYELYNLTQLSVVNCNVFDLSPLRELTNLKNLCLDYNEIEDISDLSELSELRYLSLYANMIEEVDELEELYHLKELNLGDNPIEDISCIADLIIDLDYFDVDFADLDLQSFDYPEYDELYDIIGFVNYERQAIGLDDVRLNDDQANYFLEQCEEYYDKDDKKIYIDILKSQYNMRPIFRKALSLEYVAEYDSIVDWIGQEYADVADSLITSDYGDSTVFVSMHYENDYLIVEMAVEDF